MSDIDIVDVIGMAQRQKLVSQQAELNRKQAEIASLLREQQAEAKRVGQLPKCPACAAPVELEASLCRHCNSPVVITPRFTSGVANGYHIALLSHAGKDLFALSERLVAAQRKTEQEAKQSLLQVVAALAPLLYFIQEGSPYAERLGKTPRLLMVPAKLPTEKIVLISVVACSPLWLLYITFVSFHSLSQDNDLTTNLLVGSVVWLGFPLLVTALAVTVLNARRRRRRSRETKSFDEMIARDEVFRQLFVPTTLNDIYLNASGLMREYDSHCQTARAILHDYRSLASLAGGLGVKISKPFEPTHVDDLGVTLDRDPSGWRVIIDRVFQHCRHLLGPSAVPSLPNAPPKSLAPVKARGVIGMAGAALSGAIDKENQASDNVLVTGILDALNKFPDAPALYLRRGGHVVGPLSATKAIESAQAGKLNGSDLISLSETGPWLAVSASPLGRHLRS